MPKIVTNLWFDTQGREAAEHYTSIFPNSKITGSVPYDDDNPANRPAGADMVVEFELDGQPFVAINGGPDFPFTEAVSLEVRCESEADLDHYWERLGDGGQHGPCGWLKDRYGLSWQVTPHDWYPFFDTLDEEQRGRAMQEMYTQSKLDMKAIKAAALG